MTHPPITLFIRSYPGDFKWLKYSVRSMHKNLTGISEKILVVPNGSVVPVGISSFFDRIYYVPEQHTGYIQQQLDKVNAAQSTGNEYILFSDSDCMYYHPFDARRLISHSNKITLYKTPYTSLCINAQQWQAITQKATGIYSDFEYMRRHPIMHHADTCRHLSTDLTFRKYVNKLKDHSLSEFNALGVIAEQYYPHFYNFINTEDQFPETIVKQYWSWGGITPEIQSELDTL